VIGKELKGCGDLLLLPENRQITYNKTLKLTTVRYLFIAFICLSLNLVVFVQEASGQQQYTEHKVQRKETFYFLSQKYGVTIDEIRAANPGLKQLKHGRIIKIPKIEKRIEKRGGDVISHTIAPGETLYSVSRRYGVTINQIIELNPWSDKTFTSGKVLVIPVPGGTPHARSASERQSGIYHVVTRGETLFGLSQTYQVPMSDIIRDNPKLEKNPVKTGDTLYIATDKKPEEKAGRESVRVSEEKEISEGNCIPLKNIRSENDPVRIALLLPLMLESNLDMNAGFLSSGMIANTENETFQTDSVGQKKGLIQFQGSSENFIHFYEGVLLALDSLKESGISVDLQVYDTEQKSSRVKSLVSGGKLDNVDLIIGPVYPNEQREITDYAFRKEIPVISPLSGSDEITRHNPFFFQVNPTRDHINKKTSEYIVSAYKGSNILVIQNGIQESTAEEVMADLKKELALLPVNGGSTTISFCDYRKKGFSGMKEMLEKGRRNIIVLHSTNEPDVSSVVSNMKYLTDEYDITLLGTNRFPQFESINPDLYHQAKLEFLTPYWADLKDNTTRSFVFKFRDYFKQEPNQFSMQGYDITFFFVKAMVNFGKDFRSCLPYATSDLVQGSYHFSKLQSGGYINNGLSVIHYTPGYEILRKKVIIK
jgi:LysM repeat protein/ABC-type branched-subunit amino acid transport system substrate-binding protein